ncbi:MAG: hypothetical protein H0U49_12450 [Parachlamydiaceae bacterium]|nr:hypothetical protein [Parachlamydiaceae bacterium]
MNALSFFKNKKIRDFALKQIAESKRSYIYTNLLIANYKNGDGKLLRHLLHEAHSIELVHSLAESYIKIFQTNRDSDCKATLVDVYDKLNCAICRKDIIEILIKYKFLPSKIYKEIQFDSSVEIQKLYLNQKLLISNRNKLMEANGSPLEIL